MTQPPRNDPAIWPDGHSWELSGSHPSVYFYPEGIRKPQALGYRKSDLKDVGGLDVQADKKIFSANFEIPPRDQIA